MRVPMKTTQARYEIDRSVFIAYLVPFERFRDSMKRAKERYPKASHIPWAFRAVDERGRIREGFSDDGEPKGCAGMPILKVLQGAELVECAVYVVRFFGGIKLGTGGMARAYAKAASLALKQTQTRLWTPESNLRVGFSFNDSGKVERLLAAFEGLEIQRAFDENGVNWHIKGPSDTIERVRSLLEEFKRRG